MNIHLSTIHLSTFREHFYNVKYTNSTLKYINCLFNDLVLRESSTTTITRYSFKELFNINSFIADKLYKSFIKSYSENLNRQEFVDGFVNLFFGDLDQLIESIFNIIDFGSNGDVHKQDIKLVLSHIPQKRDSIKNELINQKAYFKEIEDMINFVFLDKDTLSKIDFSNLIKNKASDIIILLAGYLYNNIPIHQDNVDKMEMLEGFHICSNQIHISEYHILVSSRASYSGIDYFKLEDKIKEKDYESEDCDEEIKVHKVINFVSKFNHDNNLSQSTFEDKEKLDNLNEEYLSSSIDGTDLTNDDSQNRLKPSIDIKINEGYYEGEIYKLTEKTNKMKKYKLCLVNKDIFYYKYSSHKEFKGMHNLSGCFILESQTETIDNKIYYSFMIIFTKKVRVFYTDSSQSNQEWISKLMKATSYRDISEFYEFKNTLGEGKYGHVKLAIHKETNEKVAIKILSKKDMNLKEIDLARTEIDIFKFCKHPNIIRFIDSFENYKYLFLVVEYLQGGDFKEYVFNRNYSLKEDKCAKIMKQIGEALQYLHMNGIIHRDIKPENILVSNKLVSQYTVFKIMDFGLSKIKGINEKARESYGTLCYVAPEILLKKPYDEKIDIYSLGIVLYYTLSKKIPFDYEHNEDRIIKRTLLRNPEFPSKNWSNRSRESMELIKLCLCKDDERRITINDFLKCPWINQ